MALPTKRLAFQLPNHIRHATAAAAEWSKPLRKLDEECAKGLQEYKDMGWWHTTVQVKDMKGADLIPTKGKNMINMLSNSYLMLNGHPRIFSAIRKALDTHSTISTGGSGKLIGLDIHRETEAEIARYHGTEDAVLYNSLYLGNTFIVAVATKDDLIISDANNHASIIMGVRLSPAKKLVYKTLDMKDLEAKLIEGQKFNPRRTFIFTDGIFSMEGTIVDIIKMRELADKYNAVIVNDDCHGAGVIGATGRGTDEYYGVKNYSDIITGSCGKAGSGCNGGYVCGPANFTTYLRHTSRQWFMSTFNSVADCAAIKESFKIMSDEPEHVKTLQENIIYFKKNLLSQGFDLPGIMEAGVVPIIIGSERTVYEVYDRLLERGIIGVGVRFPAVPKGHGRMRFTVNRAISKSQMDYVVNAMVEIRKELGGLPEITGDAIELTRGDQSKKLVSKVITLSKSDY